MASGIVTATLTQSAAAAGIAPTTASLMWPHSDALKFGLLLLGSAVVTMGALLGVAKQVSLFLWRCICLVQRCIG